MRVTITCLCLIVATFIGSIFWLYGDRRIIPIDEIEYSAFIKDVNGEYLHILTASDQRYRLKTHINDVDKKYVSLLLNYEDKRFYEHGGVDVYRLVSALWQNIKQGRIVSGASTITMQVVKLLDRKPRTFKNKILEIRRALQLERQLSKDQILSLYMSITPFGGNIESVNMAALYWFGKRAKYLTPSEASLLVALPQSPERRRPDRFLQRATQARDAVLERAKEAKVFDEDFINDAKLSVINTKSFVLPKKVPHLIWYCISHDLVCEQSTVNSSIQATSQRIVEQVTLQSNINIGVLIAEARSGNIVTYIGSQDYFNTMQHGAFDYIQAYRSPGSTLKPFIYALGVDSRKIAFTSIIDDIAKNYQGYRPENISLDFAGEISIAEALKLSLNVPAVQVLQMVGVSEFLNTLNHVNINYKNAEGLSVALGGGGLRLWDLVSLYSVLSNSGKITSLRVDKTQKVNLQSLFEKNTIQQLNTILSDVNLGDGRISNRISPKDIALKTGTGPNQSDAIAIGSNGQYIVGVWIGSINGSGLQGNLGAKQALPVVLKLIDTLPLSYLDKKPLEKTTQPLLRINTQTLMLNLPADGSIIEVDSFPVDIDFSFQNALYPILVQKNNHKFSTLVKDNSKLWFETSGGYDLTFIDQRGKTLSMNIYIKSK